MLKDTSRNPFDFDLFAADEAVQVQTLGSTAPAGVLEVASMSPGYVSHRQVERMSAEAVSKALLRDAVAKRVMGKGVLPAVGDLVGIRLNLNVLKCTGVAVHTVHRGRASGSHRAHKGFWSGEVLGYAQTVTLREAYFNVHQVGRESIASGASAKHPMASVDGILDSMSDEADFGGVEVRFNPRLVHLFVDHAQRAVRYADEVTLRGSRCYLRGRIVYFDEATWVKPVGSSPSMARMAGKG